MLTKQIREMERQADAIADAKYYLFGNKGAVWTNTVHIAQSGDSVTLCGTPMLSSNWASIEGVKEAGCPKCLAKVNAN